MTARAPKRSVSHDFCTLLRSILRLRANDTVGHWKRLHACNDGYEPTVCCRCTTSSSCTRGDASCAHSYAACACKFFCVNKPSLTSLHVPRTTTEEKSSRSSSHTHSLPRGSPVGGSFLPCNFNNHILQPLDKMASQDRRRDPPRFFFWFFYQRLLVTRERESYIFFVTLHHLNFDRWVTIDDKLYVVDN